MDDLSMLQPKNDDDGRFGKTDWGGELEGYLQVRLAKVICEYSAKLFYNKLCFFLSVKIIFPPLAALDLTSFTP